jgi:hypothetical protein
MLKGPSDLRTACFAAAKKSLRVDIAKEEGESSLFQRNQNRKYEKVKGIQLGVGKQAKRTVQQENSGSLSLKNRTNHEPVQ